VKHQFASNRVVRGAALFQWPLALIGEATVIARQVYAELKRLNRGGNYREARISGSRRKRAQAFKDTLARRYREHNGCC
jgi:hypothetical protein